MWERIGERAGGTVAGLAAVAGPDGAATVYAATPVGVLRSDDGGATWAPTSTTAAVPFAVAVAASPDLARDGTLFAAARDGLYRSRDAGRAWERVLLGGPIFAVAVSPTFAEDRTLLVATAEDGVLRSEDGGTTWGGANAGLLDLTVLSLALSPRFDEDRTAFAGTASGLYRTRNGGKAWREVDLGADDLLGDAGEDAEDNADGAAGAGELAVQALAVSPAFGRDRLVLAATEAHGLLRSDDAGATWEPIDDLAGRGVTALATAARRGGPPRIAAATEDGVLVSDDGGETWAETGPTPGPALALAFVGGEGAESLLVGLAGRGVARLSGDGRGWAPANAGLHATPLAMLAPSPDLARDGVLFAASSDGVVLVSRDGGASWSEWDVTLDVPAVAGLAVSPRFAEDRTAWVATGDGPYRTRDAGASWSLAPSGAVPGAGPVLRSLAVATSEGGAVCLFAVGAAGDLLRSDDGGETWQELGPVAAGVEAVGIYASPDYARDRTLLAVAGGSAGPRGEGGMVLWRSTDGGRRWGRWLEAPGAGMLALATASGGAGPIVGAGRQVLAPMPGARERRGGAARPLWLSADLGPDVAAVVALATPDGPDAGRVVFAATNAGVYVSRDGGRSFAPWSEGLAPPSVVALAPSPSYAEDRLVYAVGLGGTVWRRRDA
jgi:photosystem II stability/assembly factor-like uncharacterized protein